MKDQAIPHFILFSEKSHLNDMLNVVKRVAEQCWVLPIFLF